jgi:molybdate transport system substrate-binding protein
VRAALALVARGEAPLGIVYASDALAEPRVQVLATFPGQAHPAIVYPLAPVAASRHPQVANLLGFLRSAAAADVFRRHGFLPLPSSGVAR